MQIIQIKMLIEQFKLSYVIRLLSFMLPGRVLIESAAILELLRFKTVL